jgi:hypothetical protein
LNLGIDPLIRNIREKYQECGYSYDDQERKKERKKGTQAYADDLLVFADTREHLNILVEGLVNFMKYAHTNFNPKKCRILIHNPEKISILPYFYQMQIILNKKLKYAT